MTHSTRPLLAVIFLSLLVPAAAAAQTGAITGTVKADGSSAPLAGVTVFAVDSSGNGINSAETDVAGAYTIPLAPGTYYLQSYNATGYVDEFYNNVPCVGICYNFNAPSAGTAVVVSPGATTSGHDFSLALGGTIAGRVTYQTTGAGIAGAFVYASTPSGLLSGVGIANASGDYQIPGLPTASFVIHTVVTGYVNEVYDNLACVGFCFLPRIGATTIAVAAGVTVGGKDFALIRAARINGVVTSEASGAALPNIRILARDSQGNSFEAFSDATGVYELGGLPAGSYRVYTQGVDGDGYFNEIYDNVICPIQCDLAQFTGGTAITVPAESVVSNINFALAAGGRISGVVTDQGTGTPLQGVTVRALMSAAGGFNPGSQAATDASGAFTIPGLPAGIYYVQTRAFGGYIDETYPDIPCLNQCDPSAATIGGGIVIANGAAVGGLAIGLAKGGRVSGAIHDASTLAPLQGQTVTIVDVFNRAVSRGVTDATGAYLTRVGVPGGTYYAVVIGDDGYLSKIFNSIPCDDNCFGVVGGKGTPIVVTAGATATGKDFLLDRGGIVKGRVTHDGTGEPLPSTSLLFYDAVGRGLTGAGTNASGLFETSEGIAANAVYVVAGNLPGFTAEVYNNKPCGDNCVSSLLAGNAIPVSPSAPTTGIDFALAPATGVPLAPLGLRSTSTAGGIVLDWQAPRAGAIPAGYRLEAGFAPGTTALTIPVTGLNYLAAGVPPGRYYLRVRGVNAAGVGAASTELTLAVGPGSLPVPGPPHLDGYMIGSRLTLFWSPQETGGPASDFVVEAGSATGLSNIATITADRRAFTYTPVPNGVYFLRVRGRNGAGVGEASKELMIVAGGAPSPPGMVMNLGGTASGSTVTLAWEAPAGPVTGYVIEAGSAPGLSNLATLPIGNQTAISFPGIPPGKYYVRIRAVNALGRSIASEEIAIVVG